MATRDFEEKDFTRVVEKINFYELVIYDVDYTLISVASFTELVLYTFRKYPIKLLYLPVNLTLSVLVQFKLIPLERYKESWLLIFQGFSHGLLQELSKEFFYNVLIHKIKPGVMENIIMHKQQGYKIIIFP